MKTLAPLTKLPIRVTIHGKEFVQIGRNKWPWDCADKTTYPDAMHYRGVDGTGWTHEYDGALRNAINRGDCVFNTEDLPTPVLVTMERDRPDTAERVLAIRTRERDDYAAQVRQLEEELVRVRSECDGLRTEIDQINAALDRVLVS